MDDAIKLAHMLLLSLRIDMTISADHIIILFHLYIYIFFNDNMQEDVHAE